MNIRQFFRDVGCSIGLHQWSAKQTEQETVQNRYGYTVLRKSREFHRCANTHCQLERGEETKEISPLFIQPHSPERWTDIYWRYPDKTPTAG